MLIMLAIELAGFLNDIDGLVGSARECGKRDATMWKIINEISIFIVEHTESNLTHIGIYRSISFFMDSNSSRVISPLAKRSLRISIA